jgi:hypothetical protein
MDRWSTNLMNSEILKRASCYEASSSPAAGPAPDSGRRMTNVLATWPRMSSGIPTTAALTTEGWATEHGLDLGGGDVLAPSPDHVLDPASMVDITEFAPATRVVALRRLENSAGCFRRIRSSRA